MIFLGVSTICAQFRGSSGKPRRRHGSSGVGQSIDSGVAPGVGEPTHEHGGKCCGREASNLNTATVHSGKWDQSELRTLPPTRFLRPGLRRAAMLTGLVGD
jgi:hypothetical protein